MRSANLQEYKLHMGVHIYVLGVGALFAVIKCNYIVCCINSLKDK